MSPSPAPGRGAARPFSSWIAFVAVAVGLVAVAGFITWQGMTRSRTAEAARESGVVTIAVDGMSCVGCAGAVETSIERVPGVADVTVDYEARLAHIRLADQSVPPERLIAAIERAGYKARLAP